MRSRIDDARHESGSELPAEVVSSVRPAHCSGMAYEITADEIEGLSEDQQVAIMESLLLAVTADHQATAAETKKLDAAINAIPWRMAPAKVMEHLLAARTRIVGGVEVGALIQQIAQRLPAPAVREKLFHAMASIMEVDGGLNAQAKNLLGVYVHAFALTGGQIDAIKADIKAAAQQSF